MKSVKEKAKEYAETVPACFGDASEIAYAAYLEGGRDVFSRLSSNHFKGYAEGRADAEKEIVHKITLASAVKGLLFATILFAAPAYAQYQPYIPPAPQRQPGTYNQPSQYPRPGNIYVPVPSTVYEIGKGYVPSTGLAEVPGRQLNSPLGTSLGYDAVPVAPIQPQYVNPFIFSGK